MDGENNGNPYDQMDDLGGKPTIFGNTQMEFFLNFRAPFFHGQKSMSNWEYTTTSKH